MDPGQRMTLETCTESLHRTGLTEKTWANRNIAVYTGTQFPEWNAVDKARACPTHSNTCKWHLCVSCPESFVSSSYPPPVSFCLLRS